MNSWEWLELTSMWALALAGNSTQKARLGVWEDCPKELEFHSEGDNYLFTFKWRGVS